MSAGKRKLTARQLAELALLCALMVAGKEAMRFLPNVHPVCTLMILGVLLYGARVLYPVAAFVLLEIALYGAGAWSVMYLYVWPLIALAALPFRRSRSWLFWAVFAGIFGLAFGLLCAPTYWVIGGWQMALSWWASGIPYDLMHGAGNFALTLVLLPPLYRAALRAGCAGKPD